jgi:hypothetical protein
MVRGLSFVQYQGSYMRRRAVERALQIVSGITVTVHSIVLRQGRQLESPVEMAGHRYA